MKTVIAYIVLLLMASLPVAFIVWACYLPILIALPVWGLGGIGLSILAGAAWELHRENRKGMDK